MILIEQPREVINQAQLQKSKLLSMKDHLEQLIRKKYRIEMEIKTLRKAINNRASSSERSLKLKIGAEATSNPLFPDDQILLESNHPEVYRALKEYDDVVKDIDLFLDEIEDLDQ